MKRAQKRYSTVDLQSNSIILNLKIVLTGIKIKKRELNFENNGH